MWTGGSGGWEAVGGGEAYERERGGVEGTRAMRPEGVLGTICSSGSHARAAALRVPVVSVLLGGSRTSERVVQALSLHALSGCDFCSTRALSTAREITSVQYLGITCMSMRNGPIARARHPATVGYCNGVLTNASAVSGVTYAQGRPATGRALPGEGLPRARASACRYSNGQQGNAPDGQLQ